MKGYESRDTGSGLPGAGRSAAVMLALALLLLGGLLLSVCVGSARVPAGEVLDMLRGALTDTAAKGGLAASLRAAFEASTASRIIFGIRMPRMLLAALLGGALAVSGLLLQSFFRNPVAGPFVLGISSGARMTVGFTLIFLSRHVHFTSAVLVIAAFAGSLLMTSVVLLFSQRVKNMSMLLVTGIMVGYICSAVTDFFITFANDRDIVNLTGWSRGSFSGASWGSVGTALCVCLPALLGTMLLAKPMGAYALGEAYARSMGVRVRPFRLLLILLSSLLSACVTALAGPVSFVGIAVPHITHMLLGSRRPAAVIPASFLCGAVFCLFCDLLARTLFAPTELAIGTVTSVFGAPVVIVMLLRRRRTREE